MYTKQQKFIKNFFIQSISLIILIIAIVIIFDPFYQYHKPLTGLKSVLTDKEYQCPGIYIVKTPTLTTKVIIR